MPFKLGEEGIRTLGTLFAYDGFQDRSDQPLRHFSKYLIVYHDYYLKKNFCKELKIPTYNVGIFYLNSYYFAAGAKLSFFKTLSVISTPP